MSWRPPGGPDEPGPDETIVLLKRFAVPIVLGFFALVFIVQNFNTVDVRFLWLHFAMPQWLLLIVFGCIGAGVFWVVDNRRRARKAKQED